MASMFHSDGFEPPFVFAKKPNVVVELYSNYESSYFTKRLVLTCKIIPLTVRQIIQLQRQAF
jgi:hypothetical protein